MVQSPTFNLPLMTLTEAQFAALFAGTPAAHRAMANIPPFTFIGVKGTTEVEGDLSGQLILKLNEQFVQFPACDMQIGESSARPTAPDMSEGQRALWFSDDIGVLSMWDGNSWTDLTGSTVGSDSIPFDTTVGWTLLPLHGGSVGIDTTALHFAAGVGVGAGGAGDTGGQGGHGIGRVASGTAAFDVTSRVKINAILADRGPGFVARLSVEQTDNSTIDFSVGADGSFVAEDTTSTFGAQAAGTILIDGSAFLKVRIDGRRVTAWVGAVSGDQTVPTEWKTLVDEFRDALLLNSRPLSLIFAGSTTGGYVTAGICSAEWSQTTISPLPA